MAKKLHISVGKRDQTPIPFDFDGSEHEYTFTPPKQADMVLPMLDSVNDIESTRAALAWLDDGMSEEDQAHLLARLKDKNDDLDFPHVSELVKQIVEEVGDRPTT